MDGCNFYVVKDDEDVEGGVSPYLKQRQRFYEDTWSEMMENLRNSKTLYVGNLSLFTTEEQIFALFSHAGRVKRVILGIHKEQQVPCGFCFVEYFIHQDALNAKRYISGTRLDDRVIRADLDPGFTENRKYGRSKRTTGGNHSNNDGNYKRFFYKYMEDDNTPKQKQQEIPPQDEHDDSDIDMKELQQSAAT